MQKQLFLSFLLLVALIGKHAAAQHAAGSTGTGLLGLVAANSFSKEESVYRSKGYVMNSILGPTEAPLTYQVFALAAATSGELTSLVYTCTEQKKEGLLLAFYGTRWNEAGVVYQAYGFKDMPVVKAKELLSKIDKTIEKALVVDPFAIRSDVENRNVYFQYDDVTVLISISGTGEPQIRLFWGQYDSEWNIGAFRKTVRRMEKKI